jgi:hypothetical protein
MTTIPKEVEKDHAIMKCFDKFITRFKVNHHLRKAKAMKEKGIPVYELFAFLLGLVFTGKNLYTVLSTEKERVLFGKDAVYRFLQRANINWNIFLLNLSISLVSEIDNLTSEARKCAIIFDDTPYYRDRSKKVELLSRFKDHSKNYYYKGYTLLNMGWSDGQTFIPLDFRILSNSDDKKLIQGSYIKEDNRTLATKRRKDAQKGKPSLVLDMLKSVKGTSAQAKYVLFDSWFSSPSAILDISRLGYKVVARLKNHENLRYEYNGELLSINQIYSKCKKRRGKSRYLLSVVVNVRHNDYDESVPAKIIFVRNRNDRKKWLAIISTDIEMNEDEIIALYGKRWDIEPFHKVIKSGLRLEKEFQFRSFDAIIAHTTIVLTRYLVMALENRENKDERSVCALYFHFCRELEDLSFAYSFELILSAFKQWACEYIFLSNDKIQAAVEQFIDLLPDFIKGKLKLSMCES